MAAHRHGRTISMRLVAPALVAALLVGGGVGVLLLRGRQHTSRPSTATSSGVQAAASVDASHTTRAPGHADTRAFRHVTPLRLESTTPANGATAIAGTASLTFAFSTDISTKSAHPTITPATPGTWSVSGHELRFTPTTPFVPLSSVTVTLPSGRSGVKGTDGAALASKVVEHFQVKNGSILRLQQLLSLLQYSPLAFKQVGTPIAPTDTPAQLAALYQPERGSFAWRNAGWPRSLVTTWRPGVDTVFTRGLIMSFQADHGLIPNGSISASLWASLVKALADNTINTGGYNYAVANKTTPESLTVYHNGSVVVHSPANTGIALTPTPDGTFTVYERLRSQVMRGSNPDGSKYADLVQYVAYFHKSDAVHYMPRAGYGIPQSLGCIELPYAQAAQAWPYLAYGTLVTVTG